MPARFQSTRDVVLRTPDAQAAAEFYASVLGLGLAHHSDGLWGFETGAFRLYVEAGSPAHAPVFELQVPELAAARARLLAAGCTLIEEDVSVPRCYLRDPYGFVFNLGQASGAGLRAPDIDRRPHRARAERTMVAPPDVLYRAWTVEIDRWFAVPGTLRLTPRVDAPFCWETEHEGTRHPHFGRIVRLEPDRLVEMSWVSTGTKGAETLLTVSLAPNAGGTDLALVHAGFPDEASAAGHGKAWPTVLAHLDATIRPA